ncbi:hypothetical protein RIF29_37964 [Crotalaria pallida]|uniref:Uncharacterized protein n=1 Tax=Crotalaria pallida TaxID=3830 RepID=A0AAN9E098_CROPI
MVIPIAVGGNRVPGPVAIAGEGGIVWCGGLAWRGVVLSRSLVTAVWCGVAAWRRAGREEDGKRLGGVGVRGTC